MRVVDLREYRPASVLVIDLVKHSTRSKEVVYEVQHSLEDVFSSVRKILALKEVYFNYTGDGYVCALTGEASSRAVDFLNAVIPRLRQKLEGHGQSFRIGMDFGLVHLRENTLTAKSEFFDSPSIVAARLEQSAKPDQILCSQRFHDVFKDYYGEVFSSEPLSIQAKDRIITAFEIRLLLSPMSRSW
jgi:class 3 adenylate cyclase